MNGRSTPAGFTRIELLVGLMVTFAVIIVVLSRHDEHRNRRDSKVAAITGRGIHTMLKAWADDHNGDFPVAFQSSNEAFRELFKAKLMDDEKAFVIPNDPWHKISPYGKGPDNEIGTAPDFAQALTRGECAWAYVSGLNQKSIPALPILANAFSESVGVYSTDKTKKGGVFKGQRAAWVNVSGSAKVSDLSPDYKVMEKKRASTVDVFGKDWGTNPDNVKNPEG